MHLRERVRRSAGRVRPGRDQRHRPAAGQTSLYRAEANQEAFLVLSGECALLVEDEERRLRPWDFFHARPTPVARCTTQPGGSDVGRRLPTGQPQRRRDLRFETWPQWCCPSLADRATGACSALRRCGRCRPQARAIEELFPVVRRLVGPAVPQRVLELRPKKLLPTGIGLRSELRRSMSALEGPDAVCLDTSGRPIRKGWRENTPWMSRAGQQPTAWADPLLRVCP